MTSVYHKILQLQKLLAANEASVAQLESHYRDVEFFLKAGTAPRLDLLKTEVDLAHARDNLLLVRNNLDSAFELLKNLMGMEDAGTTIAVVEPKLSAAACPSEEESMRTALAKRPDYRAVAKKKAIAEDRIRVAQGQMVSRCLRVRPVYKEGGGRHLLPGRLVSRVETDHPCL